MMFFFIAVSTIAEISCHPNFSQNIDNRMPDSINKPSYLFADSLPGTGLHAQNNELENMKMEEAYRYKH